jgi:uridine kinase
MGETLRECVDYYYTDVVEIEVETPNAWDREECEAHGKEYLEKLLNDLKESNMIISFKRYPDEGRVEFK